ncbi:S8 family peptidase [Psychroflexus sediminis]|uniref:Peptidase inhibitor I9 n=1 Tax=Psychroflexus sediminis TaxID=470826 RepID=A0A1G7VY19_9FLAO|nr:S8 family peptidase [Psychroflexus sediminis]SDG64468.1 Peptidase inhibitor I9 [Psychroflexus sediminis]
MKHYFNFKFLLFATFALSLFSCSEEVDSDSLQNIKELDSFDSANTVGESQFIPGQYIVVLNGNLTEKNASLTSEDARGNVLDLLQTILSESKSSATLEPVNVYARSIAGATLKLTETQADLLRKDKRVSYVEQDRIVQFAPPCGTPNGGPCDPTDPVDDGGGGDTSSQETPWGITRVNGATGYTGTNVAWVLDSGIDLDHPDLNVDASRGYNAFTSGRDGKSTDDGNGHGTHVAGTIAALNNSVGVIGVAPGATVVPVKVLDSRGSGSYSGVIAGVDHVAANGSAGDVANMSLGGPVSVALEDAIKAAAQQGINFMLAAGNEAQDANNVSPARVNGTNIYTISAMSQGDNWASFSNFGNPPVDYCAPGVSVKSTWKDGAYNTISGTSMATPHAAGVLLLGAASTSGTVNGDPDGTADAIITH